MNKLKWLYPGIGIKRWVLLVLAGFFLLSTGLAIITNFHFGLLLEKIVIELSLLISGDYPVVFRIIIGVIILNSGIWLVLWSLGKIEKRFNQELLSDEELVDVLYERKLLEKGPRVVSLGGGTGLSNLLRGLKIYTSNLTAIVTVADDGGSSGRLRTEMGILPPGDIRNCLIALADMEPLMEKLLQHRFSKNSSLQGHSFGNLFIASMNEVVGGNFEEAVQESSKVLAIKGQVLPATNENVQLGAIYDDNQVKMGESVIPVRNKKIKKVFLKPASCEPTAAALRAIKEAEIITIGPGSLYTSILPNLLVPGIAEAIRNSRAPKIYICNLMTQPGETDNYTASDHLQAISLHVGDCIVDYVIVNHKQGPEKLRKRYQQEGAYPVKSDHRKLAKMNVEVISGDLLSENEFLRHDPLQTAAEIFSIIEK